MMLPIFKTKLSPGGAVVFVVAPAPAPAAAVVVVALVVSFSAT